ncbi:MULTISPECIES: hypothetical protein [unclassified Butyrivibrio]|uniref:hypothetical protein n=1 Tax=Butyrivibrio sp. LC3010 TaxID=1280680 RepID=UPI000407EC79|nr:MULTISPECIES: hypothetical protein [unclassified Butyrivibrio]
MVDRENLINALAASMGVVQFDETKYTASRYDPKTGTLYCNGMAISKVTADKAVRYFESVEKKFNSDDPDGRELKMIYRCAIEAIKMMQTEKVKKLFSGDAKEFAKNK